MQTHSMQIGRLSENRWLRPLTNWQANVSKRSKELRLARQAPQHGNTGMFQVTAHAAHFSGPLPPPEILVKYNDAVPGGAERIIAMAEEQSRHRQALESAVIATNCTTQKTGPIFGFIISMTAILGGIYLISAGKSAEGLTSIVTSLVALASVFIVGRVKQKKELENKSAAIVPANQS